MSGSKQHLLFTLAFTAATFGLTASALSQNTASIASLLGPACFCLSNPEKDILLTDCTEASEEGSDFKKALCRNPKTGERTKKPIAIKEPWLLIKDGEERCSSCDRVATSFTKDFGILSSPTEKIIYKAPDDDLYNLKDIQIPTDNQLQLKIEQ